VRGAIGFTYQQEGHYFYVLQFPDAGKTWVYDMTSDTWHERKSGEGPWRITSTIENNQQVFGFDGSRRIYKIDASLPTEDGAPILRQMVFPNIHFEDKRLSFDKLRLDLQVGKGDVSIEPKVILDYSDDGGETFRNSLTMSLGRAGQYLTRPVFYRLGQARNRVFRIRFYDPFPFSLFAAYAEVVPED
jgi:hypothetical protein